MPLSLFAVERTDWKVDETPPPNWHRVGSSRSVLALDGNLWPENEITYRVSGMTSWDATPNDQLFWANSSSENAGENPGRWEHILFFCLIKKHTKMETHVFASHATLRSFVVDRVAATLARVPNAVLGLTTGTTPLTTGIYDEIVRRCHEQTLDLTRTTLVNPDEFMGLPNSHEQTYHTYSRIHLLNRLSAAQQPAHWIIPDRCVLCPTVSHLCYVLVIVVQIASQCLFWIDD
jgi:hypothetical protein